MKKLFLSLIVAVCSLAASAQAYVGGQVGLWRNTDANHTSFNLAPELGYKLSNQWDLGLSVGFAHNYYDGTTVTIPLDIKYSPSKNAQIYFKKYGKSKTAVKEKALQIEENDRDIQYLESVLSYIENADSADTIEALRSELTAEGYLKRRKNNPVQKKQKTSPVEYVSSEGFRILVGRNNTENDTLTLKMAGKTDLWLHTKDIPGSHVIVFTEGKEPDKKIIFEAAAIAAYHSKARNSEQVPVDYVPVKYVKKPSGAKPGMVIFTNNRTVYVKPAIPDTAGSR